MIRILAIDGGGVRGLIPALILDDIEKRTGLDFFPLLKDSLESTLETADPDSMWSD